MKNHFKTIGLLLVFFSSLSFAKSLEFRPSPGEIVALDLFVPSQPGKPTFLLLPGVNRGLLPDDEVVTKLRSLGFGVVVFNLAEQPLSLARLDKNEEPAFLHKQKSLSDLALDVQSLAQFVAEQLENKSEVIPVSLSYTGAISSFLKGFSLVIDVVPMTASSATNPDLEKYRDSLRLAEFWNPVFGPSVTRSMLDSAYRTKWGPQVDKMIEQFSLPKSRRELMIQGYTALSRASEGFVWGETQADSARRIFLVAGEDSKSLLKNQLQTFLQLLKRTSNSVLFMVRKSGHVLPSEQPVIYAQILNQITQDSFGIQSGVIEIIPGDTTSTKSWSGDAAEKQLKQWIQQTEK